jgi:hypothetical protein
VADRDIDEIDEAAKRDALVERAARWICEKGLATPAIFLLEMHKPVAPLASMLMLGSMPFLGPFVGFGALERFALLAEDRGNVERLVARIEALSAAARTAMGPDVKRPRAESAE